MPKASNSALSCESSSTSFEESRVPTSRHGCVAVGSGTRSVFIGLGRLVSGKSQTRSKLHSHPASSSCSVEEMSRVMRLPKTGPQTAILGIIQMAVAKTRPEKHHRDYRLGRATRSSMLFLREYIYGWLSKLWSLFGYAKYWVPYYNRDPKSDHNFDTHIRGNIPILFNCQLSKWQWKRALKLQH